MCNHHENEYALSPEEEALACEIAGARIAAMRERALNIPKMNKNELKAFRQFFSILREDPKLPKPMTLHAILPPMEAPALQSESESWTAVLTLNPAEKVNIFAAIRAELAILERNTAPILSDSRTLSADFRTVLENAAMRLEETENCCLRQGPAINC